MTEVQEECEDWPTAIRRTGCRHEQLWKQAVEERPRYGCINVNPRNSFSGCRPFNDTTYGTIVFKLPESVKETALYWMLDSKSAGNLYLDWTGINIQSHEYVSPKPKAFNLLWNSAATYDTILRAMDYVDEIKSVPAFADLPLLKHAATVDAMKRDDDAIGIMSEIVIHAPFSLKDSSRVFGGVGTEGPMSINAIDLFRSYVLEGEYFKQMKTENACEWREAENCELEAYLDHRGYGCWSGNGTHCCLLDPLHCRYENLEIGDAENSFESGITGFQMIAAVANATSKTLRGAVYTKGNIYSVLKDEMTAVDLRTAYLNK